MESRASNVLIHIFDTYFSESFYHLISIFKRNLKKSTTVTLT